MAYEGIEGLKINSAKLKEQCDTIRQNYEYQNATYILLSERVGKMCEDDSLVGEAIAGFQNQMSNYKTVFEALSYANEMDKYDINTLYSVLDGDLGGGVLDGTEILENIDQSESDYNSYSWQSNYWYSEYMDTEWYDIIYMDLCYYTYLHYEKLAGEAMEDKTYWESRGQLLLDISSKLSGLFSYGSEFRDCANEGIKQISTAFNSDTSSYNMGDSSWKDEFLSMVTDSVIDEDGDIDMALVKQIASKDADAISETEYMLLAYAYVNTDVDDLEEFFMACRVPEDVDYQKRFNMRCRGEADNLADIGGMEVFTLDSDKVANICSHVDAYQANLLAKIQNEQDEDKKAVLETKRAAVLQRITMANTLNDISIFYGDNDVGNFFEFSEGNEGYGKGTSLIVEYNEWIPPFQGWPATLDPHSITVTNTMTRGLERYVAGKFKEDSLCTLASYSAETAGNSVAWQCISDGVNSAISNTFASGLACFGVGIVSDVMEAEEKKEYTEHMWDTVDVSIMADEYGCNGNVVFYDDGTVDVCIYEGEHTAEIAESVGNLMGNEEFDADYVVSNTGQAFDEVNKYLNENGDADYSEALIIK